MDHLSQSPWNHRQLLHSPNISEVRELYKAVSQTEGKRPKHTIMMCYRKEQSFQDQQHLWCLMSQACMLQKIPLQAQRLPTKISAKVLAGRPICKRHCSTVRMEVDHSWGKKGNHKAQLRESLQMLLPCTSTTPGNFSFPNSWSLRGVFIGQHQSATVADGRGSTF